MQYCEGVKVYIHLRESIAARVSVCKVNKVKV